MMTMARRQWRADVVRRRRAERSQLAKPKCSYRSKVRSKRDIIPKRLRDRAGGKRPGSTCCSICRRRTFKNRFVRGETSLVSRAFIKETDDRPEELLERRVSTHSNLVTREGLASIEKHLAAATLAQGAAHSAGDDAALARAARDVRYWQSRRHSARLMPEPKADGTIQFGHTVTI